MYHTLTIKVKVSNEQIDDIMSSALAGCTYWADDAHLVSSRPDEKDLYISEALTHGCKVRIHDSEVDKWHLVTLDSFLEALRATPTFDYDDYDGLDAERILQKAIFGKVVYA